MGVKSSLSFIHHEDTKNTKKGQLFFTTEFTEDTEASMIHIIEVQIHFVNWNGEGVGFERTSVLSVYSVVKQFVLRALRVFVVITST